MATARELLEQADALMRRNTSRDADIEDTGSGIPLLTEIVGDGGARTERAPAQGNGASGKSPGGTNGAAAFAPASRPPGSDPAASDVDGIPLLTDVVADLEPISVIGAPHHAGEPSRWPDFAVREPRLDPWTVGAPAPAASTAPVVDGNDYAAPGSTAAVDVVDDAKPALVPVAPALDVDDFAKLAAVAVAPAGDLDDVAQRVPAAVVPAVDLLDAATTTPAVDTAAVVAPDPLAVFTLVPDPKLTATQAAGAPADTATGGRDDAARWEALAEEVRMQVLQRIDIFTDTGLQEQLTARLQPIVDRASADLVATINQQVGQLLRAYVAEAIEREIDKWRHDGA